MTQSKATKPVFIYLSECCNIPAVKDPCERTKEEKAAKEFGQHSLGTWRCRCGKQTKVRRVKNVDNSEKKE